MNKVTQNDIEFIRNLYDVSYFRTMQQSKVKTRIKVFTGTLSDISHFRV